MISRRIFAAAAVLCALVTPSHAQNTKAQINTQINTNLPDNTIGQITPSGLRAVTSNIVNSIMPTAPVVSGNATCFNGTTGLLKDCGSVPLPTWPGNTTTFFRGDGTYDALNIAAVSGWGTGVATAIGINVGSDGAPVLFNGAGGTPSSITLTNASGTAASLTAGNVTTNANLTGVITSVGNATSIASQTGTGTKFVVDTGPTISSPTITTAFTATGLVTYADMASAAIASSANIIAAASNVLVPASAVYSAEATTTYGTTTTFDFSTFINTAVTLTGNITTQTLSNVKAGQAGQIRFIQDGTGSRTSVWNSIFKFSGGTTPTLTTTASAVDVLFYSCISTSVCYASLNKDMK